MSCEEKFKVGVVCQKEERNTTECTKKVLNFCNFPFLNLLHVNLPTRKKERKATSTSPGCKRLNDRPRSLDNFVNIQTGLYV